MEKTDTYIINVPLMKITGLYQILSPNSPKFKGCNIFKCIVLIEMIFSIMIITEFFLNAYYFRNNIYAVTQYLMYTVSAISSLTKLYTLIKYSDTFWNCIQLSSINLLSYKYHNKQILVIGKNNSKLYSTLFTCLWLSIVFAWVVSPLILKNQFIELKHGNGTYRYEYNILNLVFPVTDKFYNENYMIYYVIEFTGTMIWGHGAMLFDVLSISMCITFSSQIKTITNSYSLLGIRTLYKSSNSGIELI